MQASLIIDGQHELGECPLWCDRTQSLYWTDIHASVLWNYQPEGHRTRSWVMPERLSVFALTGDSRRLLLGLASRLAFFDLDSGTVTPICDVEQDLPTTRLNDGRCDRQGRFVFGTLNEDRGRSPIGSFYRLDKDLSLHRLPLPGVAISNSICFSPAGTRMYYCDTLQRNIMCCDYDPVSGAIGAPQLFVDLRDAPGAPDGSAIDADGYLWSAQWGGARVARYSPDGMLDRVVAVPVAQPSCPAFGGADLQTLYVTTAQEGMSAVARVDMPASGGLFALQLERIRGLPEARFAG